MHSGKFLIRALVTVVVVAAVGLGGHLLIRAIIDMHS
jgi:hypothetical protein